MNTITHGCDYEDPCTREYLRYVGRRSVVVDHLFRVKLQGRGLAYAAGAPARGAPLAWGRSFGEALFFKNHLP